ncbi:MAG: ABC transporter ATP-binding protein [Patescibacteria group bacterium]|nr:ABC transporter ATP-binding protein [Patescibacteria group bacterium]
MQNQHEIIIETENLGKTFFVGSREIEVLKDVNLKIFSTEFVVIFGPSGCGKSTLLNTIIGLEKPTHGKVFTRNQEIYALTEDERGILRSKKMGIIHQMSYWVKALNVLENVAMPLLIEGEKQHRAFLHAEKILEELSIINLADQLPNQLSGGEQQKVALARALITNPWIIIADEPAGNLDSKSADEMMNLLVRLNKETKRTIVLVTHNQDCWELGNRRLEMKDGQIIKDEYHG